MVYTPRKRTGKTIYVRKMFIWEFLISGALVMFDNA